jgi:hypothetical protein
MLSISLAVLTGIAPMVLADVKTEERTKFEFPGVLGGIVKVFGGKSAREGVVSKVALKGDRKMSITDDTAELIDLAEEKLYRIDMKKKTYTVVTFEQMRRQMQEAMEKAKADAAARKPEAEPAPEAAAGDKEPEFEMDFKLSESGQKKKISGYDTREVVATATLREKGKSVEDGSMVVTSSMWLAPRIAATKELDDFNLRYAQKLYLTFAMENPEQMASAMAMYPGLQEAMGKLEAERVNMDGTAVLTIVKAEAVAKPDRNAPAAQQNKQAEAPPRSLGGLLGGLGRRAINRDSNENANTNASQSATFMTTSHELLSVSTTVADSDVSIPAGFKESK